MRTAKNQCVLVTGASGVLGRSIVAAAENAGIAVRQGVRDPRKANPKAEAVRLDYHDASSIPPAVAGVTDLLLMAPPLDPNAASELAPGNCRGGNRRGASHRVHLGLRGQP